MKINNENRLRLGVRMMCKIAKTLGIELEDFLAIVEEEWERA